MTQPTPIAITLIQYCLTPLSNDTQLVYKIQDTLMTLLITNGFSFLPEIVIALIPLSINVVAE